MNNDHENIIYVEGSIEGNLSVTQVEEAIRDPLAVQRWDRLTDTLFAIGKTSDERILLVIFRFQGSQTWLVLHAREAMGEEIEFYQDHATNP